MERMMGIGYEYQDNLDAKAIKMQERVMEFLGDGDVVKGREIWADRGYADLFYDLLDEDEMFAEQVYANHLGIVLNRLEKEDRERQDYNIDAYDDGGKPMDEVLVDDLIAFKKRQSNSRLLAASIAWISAVGSVAPAEQSPPQSVDIKYEQLQQLDSAATPKRIDALLNTLPDSFVQGEIVSIGFEDRQYAMDASYGHYLHDKSESAATATGGAGWEGTKIVFWRGMKEKTDWHKMFGVKLFSIKKPLYTSSDTIWNGTLLHEIAHANDWENRGGMTEKERQQLQVEVVARVQAEDRYYSQYVELISNRNKKTELEIKATEYWAEIVEAYLKGDDNLPQADFDLVKGYIAQYDPHFDRIAALQERQNITDTMDIEKWQADERAKNKDYDF